MRLWQNVLHPERYHGQGQKPPFFEGWYFKLVSADLSRRWAVIPGVFLSQEPGKAHSFVQLLDGMTGRATYHRYPLEAFSSPKDRFEVRVGPNRFTRDELALDLDSEGRQVTGQLRFHGVTSWPVSLLSPGIMGWYAWIPFMETYHGVVSLDHALEGALRVEGEEQLFEGGRGYIEKDWGRAFPSAWIWFQTNHFVQPGTCLTASVARIPWIGRSFRGFIIGLWHEGTLHRLATYTRAQIERLEWGEHEVRWTVRDRRYRLEMVARRADAMLIVAPSQGEMGRRVPETLKAEVWARFTELKSGRVLLEGAGRAAGLEMGGDLEQLRRD